VYVEAEKAPREEKGFFNKNIFFYLIWKWFFCFYNFFTITLRERESSLRLYELDIQTLCKSQAILKVLEMCKKEWRNRARIIN
jgi:hypothetical protein